MMEIVLNYNYEIRIIDSFALQMLENHINAGVGDWHKIVSTLSGF